jgi:hypothetical protein
MTIDIRNLLTVFWRRNMVAKLEAVHEERIRDAEARIIALNETISEFQAESFDKSQRIAELEAELADPAGNERGTSFILTRDEMGVVFDALMEALAAESVRKMERPQSTCDERVTMLQALMRRMEEACPIATAALDAGKEPACRNSPNMYDCTCGKSFVKLTDWETHIKNCPVMNPEQSNQC